MQAGARTLVCVVFLSAGASVTSADPLSKPTLVEARNHLALGNKLYGVRSFEEAIGEYKIGALLEPAPVFDYNLGQCHRLLGKYQEAIWYYDRFLSRGKPEGKLLDAVNGFIAQMNSELEKKAMTQKPTEPGPSPTPSQVVVAPTTAGSVSPSPEQQARPRSSIPGDSDPWYDDRLGWSLAGVGVVGLAVGGGLLLSASGLRTDANGTKVQADYNRLLDKADTRFSLATAFGIGGAGLLVAGVIKLVVHPSEQRGVARWNIEIAGPNLVARGTF